MNRKVHWYYINSSDDLVNLGWHRWTMIFNFDTFNHVDSRPQKRTRNFVCAVLVRKCYVSYDYNQGLEG